MGRCVPGSSLAGGSCCSVGSVPSSLERISTAGDAGFPIGLCGWRRLRDLPPGHRRDIPQNRHGPFLFLPTAANVVEDYVHANTVFHQPSGLRYTMIERNGEFFQRRSEAGFDGKETNVMEERIDYVIGSGNHSRSYLHRAPDGQLIELPVSWYSEGSGYWAMSPGYDWKGQKDFRRAITGDCMFCHNGYPEGDAGLERSIFPEKLPQGIDCQRCHGPGRAHVEAAMSGHAAPELVRSTIVNPGRLGRERQLEVCMQCHLKTSFHEPNEQRAFDRAIFSYRPGQPMEDFKLYFEPAGHETTMTTISRSIMQRTGCASQHVFATVK